MSTGMPSPYTAGGLRDFLRKTDLDGEGPFFGTDIWSMRHLFRLHDEQDRGRVITIRLQDFLNALDDDGEVDARDVGERFRRERLTPTLRQAILEDRYVRVDLDAHTTPTLLAAAFGDLARESEGFTPEQLTECMAVVFVTEKQSWFGREAIDHMHDVLEERLRAAAGR
ncbi:hypothetical protein [Rhizobium sp. BK176]|uniref:hypothetical protein n=1 Tax=Rhizobium sp. BK176 TaxID=2587071 RepID=UPI00216A1971|nr:hypothetical protein [Rhizobium sp. BK176]MCS4089953.1 hypothetical protein [Rhizobium sp. BK176]